MSYSAIAYRVSLERLAAVRGCRDYALLEKLRSLSAGHASSFVLEEGEDRPTLSEAFQAIIDDKYIDDLECPNYADALTYIASFLGQRLDNDVLFSFSIRWLLGLQKEMKSKGLAKAAHLLAFGETPPLLPEWIEDVSFGSLSATEVQAAAAQANGASLDRFQERDRPVLLQIGKWLNEAAAHGEGILLRVD